MKKIICLLLVFSVMLSVTSCFGTGDTTCTDHKDEDKDGKCDICSAPTEPDPGNGDTDTVNIAALPYTILCNTYTLSERSAAKKLSEGIEDATGAEFAVEKSSFKDAEYKIVFGKLDEYERSVEIFDDLYACVKSGASAYSIAMVDTVLYITATDADGLSHASNKLLSYIKGDKLLLASDHFEQYAAYKKGTETVTVPLAELESVALLSSVSSAGQRISGFDPDTLEYTAEYPSTTVYPIISAASVDARASVSVLQAAENNGVARITVTSRDGKAEKIYTVSFKFSESASVTSEVVNKDGKDGVVSFVFDDGNIQTADFLVSNLFPKYESVVATFALFGNSLATTSGDGTEEYYDLTKVPFSGLASAVDNSYFKDKTYSYNYEFWNDVVAFREGIELTSHSYSHTFEGVTERSLFELAASQYILRELCGQRALTYIIPGVSKKDMTALEKAKWDAYVKLYKSGEYYIGARSGSAFVVSAESLADREKRFSTSGLATQWHCTECDPNVQGNVPVHGADEKAECMSTSVKRWTDYIDKAVDEGGWAPFCLHFVTSNNNPTPGKWAIFESQVDDLFAHAQKLSDDGKLWIANYTDAMMYYNERSTAKVTATVYSDTSLKVSVTDEEDNDTHYMPLTVKVTVPLNWTAAEYSYEGQSGALTVHEDADGSKFVYVNVIPDVGTLTVTPVNK